MAHTSEDALRIASRRSKVAELVLRGTTNQIELANRLGAGQATICRDLAAIREAWRASSVRDFDAARGEELARLEALEREYWSAWERSKAERQSTRTKRRTAGADATDEAEVRKEGRDGDPRFLDGVLSCVKKRCELLGLDAPTKVRVGGDADAPPIRTIVLEVPAGGHAAANAGNGRRGTPPLPPGPDARLGEQ